MISEKVISIGGVNEHFNLPWMKLCENSSAKMNWKSFAGGTGILTSALQSGEIDIAVLLTEGLLLDIIKNGNLSLICFHVSNPLRWAIHVREKDSPDFSFENKRFAISRLGSGSHTMAKYLLNKKNISYDENLMIEVGSLEGGLKSLEENESDIFLWEKFTTEPFLKNHGLTAIGEVLTPWPPFSVASTKKFKNENEDLISEIIKEVKHNAESILSSDSTVPEIGARWKIQPENASRWLSEIKWDDRIPVDVKSLASILENMKKAGLIDSVPTDLNSFLN